MCKFWIIIIFCNGYLKFSNKYFKVNIKLKEIIEEWCIYN